MNTYSLGHRLVSIKLFFQKWSAFNLAYKHFYDLRSSVYFFLPGYQGSKKLLKTMRKETMDII